MERKHIKGSLTLRTRRRQPLAQMAYFATILAITVPTPMSRHLVAQVVQGQVIDSTSGMPVARGFVVLLDAFGTEVDRALSSGNGFFTLRAPSGGQYRLRSERIGFQASNSDLLDLSVGQTADFTLRVAALPVRLSAVVVPGRGRCNTDPQQGRSTVLVWEEIRKALAAAVWSDEQELFKYRNYTYRRVLDAERRRKIEETGSVKTGVTDPPFQSVPAERLARDGYVVEQGDDTWYYLPDAYTLLDKAFLNTHCFHVVRDEHERPGQVGLAFEPTAERRITDVEGTLWLDEESSELRDLEVWHTRLPGYINDRRIGGTESFLMLPSGAWIVREWQVRAPQLTVTHDPRGQYNTDVDGFTDTGGEVFGVSARDGTAIFEAPLATIIGTVYDSTTASFLGGATVTVVGTNIYALSDSTGRFQLAAPLNGEFSLSLHHPQLDSVVGRRRVDTLEIVRGSTTEVSLAFPPVNTVVRRLCGSTLRSVNSRVIFGIVRDGAGSTPSKGATVTASWRATGPTTRAGVTADREIKVNSDDAGFYAICVVPAGRPITLSAERDGKTSREATLIFPNQLGGTLSMAWGRKPGGPYGEHSAPHPVWMVDLTLDVRHQ